MARLHTLYLMSLEVGFLYFQMILSLCEVKTLIYKRNCILNSEFIQMVLFSLLNLFLS